MSDIKTIQEIDITLIEGKYLMAALVKISGDSDSINLTSEEILADLTKLKNYMYDEQPSPMFIK